MKKCRAKNHVLHHHFVNDDEKFTPKFKTH